MDRETDRGVERVRRPLWIYLISEVFLSLGIGMASYALPFLYKSSGVSDATIGTLFAVNSIVCGICALMLGSVSDRIGASRVVKFATFVLTIGYVLAAFGRHPAWWILTSTLTGFGGALLLMTENVVISALMENTEKAKLFSRFVALYTFVMGLGAVLAGPLSSGGHYRLTVLVGGGVALLAPFIRMFVRVVDDRANHLFKMPSRRLLGMAGYAAVFGIGLGLFNPFTNLIIKGQFHLADWVVSSVSAASTFMISLGSLLVAPMLRHLKYERTLLLSFGLSVLVTMALGSAHAAAPYIAFVLLRTVVSNIPGSIVDASFLQSTEATEYVQMFGVRIFGNNGGMALGSFVGGFLLAPALGWNLYILSAAFILFAYVYLRFLLRGESR